MNGVSVIIPFTEQESEKIKLFIKSLSNQTFKGEIELVFVIDGLELDNDIDNYLKTISFNYGVFGKEKTGLADTFNLGIVESRKDIILILDDYKILEDNSFIYNYVSPFLEDESLDVFEENNIISIRQSSIQKFPYLFEQYYFPYHIEKFVYNCKKQESINIISKLDSRISKRLKRIQNHDLQNINKEKLLTCIIPFKNEKIEVEKTIYSILATTEQTEIIIINDASDDGYDYSGLRKTFPYIKYIENRKSIGHGNIDLGVMNSETPYCILIDAHMRFYEDDWDIKVCEVLKNNPKSIIYGTTSIIEKYDSGFYSNEDGNDKLVYTIGAGVILDLNKDDNFRHFWAYNSQLESSKENVHETPNILGACYGFSRKWYEHIGGTYGLVQYGLSEACLAVKTWLMGGKCLRIQDFLVGHLYRKQFPYEIRNYSSDINRRFLTELCVVDKELRLKYIDKHNQELGGNVENFNNEYNKIRDSFKYYIKHYSSKFIMTIEEFDKNINSKFS